MPKYIMNSLGKPLRNAEHNKNSDFLDVGTFVASEEQLHNEFNQNRFTLPNFCDLGGPSRELNLFKSQGNYTGAFMFQGKLKETGQHDWDGVRVLFKATERPSKKKLNSERLQSWDAEAAMYLLAVPLLADYTPHLVRGFEQVECQKFLEQYLLRKKRRNNQDRKLSQFMDQMIHNKFLHPTRTTQALAIGLVDSAVDFEDALVSRRYQAARLVEEVLPQLAFTLLVMQQQGVMHHDLHLRNVLLQRSTVPLRVCYRLGPSHFVTIESSHFARIFDWDRGSKVGFVFNATNHTDHCEDLGVCNKMIPNWDWSMLLSSLLIKAKDMHHSALVKYLSSLLGSKLSNMRQCEPEEDAKGKLALQTHPCVCSDSKCLKCTVLHEILSTLDGPGGYLMKLPYVKNPPLGVTVYSLPINLKVLIKRRRSARLAALR
jgi:hypothetical protein